MLKANMRVLLVVSLALFVLCSLVNMYPAREDIKSHSKKFPLPCDFLNCDFPNMLSCYESNPLFCLRGEYHDIGLQNITCDLYYRLIDLMIFIKIKLL